LAASPPSEAPIPPAEEPVPPPSRWLAEVTPHAPTGELGTLQLAWLGDAVWELHQRLRHCRQPARSRDLHRAVVSEVRAEAQARALLMLEPLLLEGEREQVRRGRNRAGRGPRPAEAGRYGQATGFETMLGWLFLRNPRRLAELLDHLEETPAPTYPPDHEPLP
jgi:ribonuclease III family protein